MKIKVIDEDERERKAIWWTAWIFGGILGAILSLWSIAPAMAADLTFPIIVNSPQDIPASPVTYNGITYQERIIFRYLDTREMQVFYFNVGQGDKVIAVDENSTIENGTFLLHFSSCLHGDSYPGDEYTLDPANGYVSTVSSPQTLSFAPNQWSYQLYDSTVDFYDYTGTNVIHEGSGGGDDFGYDPFGGNFQFSLNGFEAGVAWIPGNTPRSGSNPPIFDFPHDDTSFDVLFGLIISPLPETSNRHVALMKGQTILDNYTFTGIAETSTNGLIEYDPSWDRYVLHLTQTGNDYRLYYFEDNEAQTTLATYAFGVQNPVGLVGSNQTEINTLCDSLPTAFYFPAICKAIIPPNNYLSNNFSNLYNSFFSKFAFLGQTVSILQEASTTWGGTPTAPVFPAIVVFGTSINTFDFTPWSVPCNAMRNFSGFLVVLFTMFLTYKQLNSLLSTRKDSVI